MAAVNFNTIPIEVIESHILPRVGDPRLARVCKNWKKIIKKQTLEQLQLINKDTQLTKNLYPKYIKTIRGNDPLFIQQLFQAYPRISLETWLVLKNNNTVVVIPRYSHNTPHVVSRIAMTS